MLAILELEGCPRHKGAKIRSGEAPLPPTVGVSNAKLVTRDFLQRAGGGSEDRSLMGLLCKQDQMMTRVHNVQKSFR